MEPRSTSAISNQCHTPPKRSIFAAHAPNHSQLPGERGRPDRRRRRPADGIFSNNRVLLSVASAASCSISRPAGRRQAGVRPASVLIIDTILVFSFFMQPVGGEGPTAPMHPPRRPFQASRLPCGCRLREDFFSALSAPLRAPRERGICLRLAARRHRVQISIYCRQAGPSLFKAFCQKNGVKNIFLTPSF